MVNDFGFGGKPGRNLAMFVRRGSNTAYIAGYGWWKRGFRDDETETFRRLIVIINHEHLHKVLASVKGRTASRAIDRRRVFGAHAGEYEPWGLKVPIPQLEPKTMADIDSDAEFGPRPSDISEAKA